VNSAGPEPSVASGNLRLEREGGIDVDGKLTVAAFPCRVLKLYQYEDETLHLADGRLLLRGVDGSRTTTGRR
jgi:hypothetical protein